jgi:hypothetical protein
MPRLACGLATRTHGVRPSEETAFRVISDLPPVGHFALDGPPRGGAGSARPQRKASGLIETCPRGRTGPARPSRENGIPRHTFGHARRTHGVRPSEETAFRVISDLPPVGHLALDGPPRGGAGSARPQRKASRRAQHCPPFGQGPSLNAPVGNATPCHLHGRTMRARRPRPSEKTTSRAFWRAVGKPWVTITCLGTCLA